MKRYFLLFGLLLSTYSHALEKLNVQLWAERDLVSNNDKYILNLHTGDWQSGGILYWIGTTNSLHFRGNQKGLDFTLSSFEPGGGEKPSEYKIVGKLTPHLNRFEAELHHLPSQNVEKVTFGSLFWQPDRPQHLIEFWGEQQPYNRVKIDEIRILERESRKLQQTIEVSHKNDIYQEGLAARYVDLNFDGYFDIAMQVGGDFEAGGYRYWLYNASTQKYELSEELSKLTRYPSRDIILRELRFLEGTVKW